MILTEKQGAARATPVMTRVLKQALAKPYDGCCQTDSRLDLSRPYHLHEPLPVVSKSIAAHYHQQSQKHQSPLV